jgi:hypothetical protein
MLVLVLIGVPVLEVFVFIEVGHAIGWLLAVLALLGISLLGTRLLRVQGRAAIDRVSLAVSERRAPGSAALEGALGVLGAVLLVAPTRKLTRRWISNRFAGRVVSFATAAGRFTSRDRGVRPADVEATAIDDDLDQLGR